MDWLHSIHAISVRGLSLLFFRHRVVKAWLKRYDGGPALNRTSDVSSATWWQAAQSTFTGSQGNRAGLDTPISDRGEPSTGSGCSSVQEVIEGSVCCPHEPRHR